MERLPELQLQHAAHAASAAEAPVADVDVRIFEVGSGGHIQMCELKLKCTRLRMLC